MTMLSIQDDELLTVARVLDSLSHQTVSFALRGETEMQQFDRARRTIDAAAQDVIHSSRSGRRDILSPDCGVAKHPACHGDAWNHKTDQPTPCECACHQSGDHRA